MLMTASKGSSLVAEMQLSADPLAGSATAAVSEQFVGPVAEGESATATSGLKRYAIVGNDLVGMEFALAEMGRAKIKNFQHFSGLAVHLSEAEAEALRAKLGPDVRILVDEPFQVLAGAESGKEKSGNALAA
jgi:hypothetical protein